MNLSVLMILLSSARCQLVPENPRSNKLGISKLSRLDPVTVGHERKLKISSNQTVIIKTAAVYPPIFEIEEFLSDSECDYIKELGEKKKFETSVTIPGKHRRYGGKHHQLNFQIADKNHDNFVDYYELLYSRPPVENSHITIEDIPEFVELYEYDTDGNKKLTEDEFNKIDVQSFYDWTYKKMEDPRNLGRLSNQVWLTHESDDFLRELKDRVVSLTGLPKKIIDASESMQVVNYDVGGHYHAHFDSENIKVSQSCIHTREIDGIKGSADLDYKAYRLCRYATLMYYLSDVTEGGETAFPVADNQTVSEKVLFAGGDIGDLSHHCKDANLIVKPKKGKAVLWYNHLLNDDGWLGKKDTFSFHGGCDIKQGTKWIANHWITVDSVKERQIRFMDFWGKKYGKDKQQQHEQGEQSVQQKLPQLSTEQQTTEGVNIQHERELKTSEKEKQQIESFKQQQEMLKEFQNLRSKENGDLKEFQTKLHRSYEEKIMNKNRKDIKDEL